MNHTTETARVSTADEQPPPQQTADQSAEARPSFCLLGADYENNNLGIRALTTGALIAIEAQYPNASVQILEYGTAPRQFVFDLPRKTYHVEVMNMRFSKKPWVKNHIARLIATALLHALVPSGVFRKKLVLHNPWLQSLMRADYVLALNYGDSFSDMYGIQRFFYVSLPQILALILKRPVVQLPQTIGPFKLRTCRVVAKWILSRSALVYTRDEEAVAAIRTLVPAIRAEKVRFCHDLGFIVPPKVFTPLEPPLDRVFSHRPVVGFNVSGLLWIGGYTRDNMFGLAVDYKTLVRKTIAHLIEEKDATVLLVPHLLGNDGEADVLACDDVFRDLQHVYPNRIVKLRPPYSDREIKHVIGQCDFFVGARMHACIAALSQCVPVAAMAYSGKFIGVLRSVVMDSTVVDLRNLGIGAVLAVLDSSFDARELQRMMLKQRVPIAQATVLDLFRDLQKSRATDSWSTASSISMSHKFKKVPETYKK